MASSVKLRDADKARLDRLQAQITAATGRRVSQEELLGRLVGLGESHRTRLTAAPGDGSAGLERLMALPVKTGIVTGAAGAARPPAEARR